MHRERPVPTGTGRSLLKVVVRVWTPGVEDTRAVFQDGRCQGRMNDTEVAAYVCRALNGLPEDPVSDRLQVYVDALMTASMSRSEPMSVRNALYTIGLDLNKILMGEPVRAVGE